MRIKLLLLAPVLTLMTLSSCTKKEGCMDETALNYDPEAEVDAGCTYGAANYAVEMYLHQYINDVALVENQTYTINGVATDLDLVQFYVSGITLIDADGFEYNSDTYLLVKPEIEAYNIGDFPAGDYTKVIFNIGVDSITNHGDPSLYQLDDPLAAQTPSMHWGWSFGYIFTRIDGQADIDADGVPDAAGAFEMHTGEDRYLATIEIDMPVTIGETQENILHIAADWSTFFSGVDMANDNTVHGSDNEPLANLLFDNTLFMFSPED